MTSISTSNSWPTYKSRRRRRRPTLLGGCTRCFRWSVMCTSTGRQWGWCTASRKADNRELSLAFSAAQTSNWHCTEACIWLPRIWCHPWANILSLETGKQKNFSSLPFPALPSDLCWCSLLNSSSSSSTGVSFFPLLLFCNKVLSSGTLNPKPNLQEFLFFLWISFVDSVFCVDFNYTKSAQSWCPE